MSEQAIRLTQYSHGAGCGCKISPKVLETILHSEQAKFVDPNLLVGNETSDDAAVYDLGNGTSIVSTTDFFMPIVDNPFDFGRIAATNAISDIFAMGGKPIMAIAILGWPINTCGGAFAGLDKVISHRVETGSGIGFGATVKAKSDKASEGELLAQVEPEDLIKFGLIPEFIGRLPVVATLNELSEEALIQILKEPKNALTKQYQALFSLEGAELEFRDEALDAIAKKAMARKTGARGLRSIVEAALLDTMYDLPSMEDVEKVVIDESVIAGQSKPLLIYGKPEAQQASGE